MLLRNLFEAATPDADAAFAFGRFNPAHQGHIEVYKAVQSAGDKWFIGTNPSTQGPNDPLTFKEKSAWMQAIYPPIKGHILPEQSVVTLASRLYEMLGDDKTIAYVTDEKDWQWAGKLLNDYNGKEGPHGYYNFRKILHVESPRVSSATALRTAARAGDEAAFYAASGTNPKLTINGKTYFDTVVDAVGANPEKVKKVAKKKQPEVTEVAVPGETIPTSEFVKGIYSLAAEYGSQAPNPEAVKKMMVLAPNQEVDVQKTFQKIIATFQAQLPKIKQMMAELDALIKQAEAQGVAEGWFDSKPKVDFKARAKELFAKGLTEQQVLQQLIKEGCPPNQAAVFVQGAQLESIAVIRKQRRPQGVAEGVGDKRTDPAPGKEFVSNKFYVKFTPDRIEFYRKGDLVYTKSGDYSTPTRGDYSVAKGITSQLWEKEYKQGVAEGESKAMAQAAKRLTDPKDGAVAKLRAAGDKRREDQLKGRNIAKRNESVNLKADLQELSSELLGKYKKAAGADASKADKAGDFKRGDKRFSGIIKATNKQFDNDLKGKK